MSKRLENEFVDLMETNQNILHKICKLYTYDFDSHQDLFQEMIIQLWKSYPSFKGESKFTSWLYRVALNTAITLHRAKKRNIPTVDWDISFQNFKFDEYDTLQDDQLNFLYSAVRKLNDIEKALVYMYLEDKDYAEIAETLGISEVNARVKMNRIKNKLKSLVQKEGIQ